LSWNSRLKYCEILCIEIEIWNLKYWNWNLWNWIVELKIVYWNIVYCDQDLAINWLYYLGILRKRRQKSWTEKYQLRMRNNDQQILLSSESQFWFPCILPQNQIRWTVSCNLVLFPKILVWACSVESFNPIYLTYIWWHLFKNNTFRQLVLALMNTKFNRCN